MLLARQLACARADVSISVHTNMPSCFGACKSTCLCIVFFFPVLFSTRENYQKSAREHDGQPVKNEKRARVE